MLRGVKASQEVQASHLIRDTRTVGQRVAEFFKTPSYVAVLLIGLSVASFMISALSDLFLLIGLAFFAYTYTRPTSLPMRMPQRSELKDYNDTIPGTTKPKKASGITFFGNDGTTNEELWFTNDDMRTHVLIFGSTGSGKTEALISIAYNSLLQSSGMIYVDGKGDNSLYAKLFSMARSMGREDDVLLINFMTGARDIIGAQEHRLSNTLNPFCQGSSSMLTQLVVSLMGSSGSSSDGDMWKGRAITFIEALMKILVYMRDEGFILLDANTIRNYFHLDKLETMCWEQSFPRDEQGPIPLDDAPDLVMEPLKNYILNLPGYNKEKKGKQVSQVLEQHGFITMQLVRVFSSMADTYGHIIRTNLAEVDFKDVVLNRRILIVLLPALEKSPDELATLGKIIVASLKAMMAAGLGDEVEGEFRDVIERKPTNAPTPFLCILDEYGYYAVQGFAVVPAQARSLGFSAVFAGQDLPAFQKASKEEAMSIGANTNIKICMKLEDPLETWDFFNKTAGEAYVTKVDSFQTKDSSVTNTYLDAKSASFEKRSRVDLLDLKDQGVGDAHIFFKSKIVRARMFYANPKPVKVLKLNHFLKVVPPPDAVLLGLKRRLDHFAEVMQTGDYSISESIPAEEIEIIAKSLSESEDLDPIERGVSALLAYHNREEFMETEEEEVEEPEGVLNIFVPLRADDDFVNQLLTENKAAFVAPLLGQSATRGKVLTVERLASNDPKEAQTVTLELMSDMKMTTNYPPENADSLDAEGLIGVIDELIGHIIAAKESSAQTAA